MQNGELISILLYLLPPILSLSILCIVRRRMIWLAVPLTAVVDLLIWGRALLYNYGEFGELFSSFCFLRSLSRR